MNYDNLFANLDKEGSSFIAKMLGIFSENLIDFWTANENCKYKNLGRPDIFDKSGNKLAQLDFTLQNKITGKCFIVEQKNLVAYNNGRIRNMTNEGSFIKSFESWSKTKSKHTPAWNIFLGPLNEYKVQVRGKPLSEFGKILIWSKVDVQNKSILCSKLSLDEILSLEQIHNELISWNDNIYIEWLNKRIDWTKELFNQLK
jgi:hypothetical protein